MERQAQEFSDQRGDVFVVLQEASADAEERDIPQSVVMQSRDLIIRDIRAKAKCELRHWFTETVRETVSMFPSKRPRC